MAGQRKYPVELRERAVALVRQLEAEQGVGRGAISQVARDRGVHKEVLRTWVRQDAQGVRAAGKPVAESPADKDARIRELERRVVELERANSILKTCRFHGSEGSAVCR